VAQREVIGDHRRVDVGGRRVSSDSIRVLVVDDSKDGAESMAALMSLNGYEARACTDATEALAVIDAFEPLCVLLDVRMPRVSGLELARQIRAKHGDGIVLIAVTGASPNDAEVAGTFELVDHYLTKPVDTAKLEKVLPPQNR
jgi:DNA-binding response OmpR family regulator